jgi:hypothetical protein
MREPVMRIFQDRRALYIATGALLTTFVVTSGSLLTFLLVTPEIEKSKDRNNLDVARNVLLSLDSQLRELLYKGPNSSSIFGLSFAKGEIRTDPLTDVMSYSIKTRVTYDPGSTSTLEADINENTGVLTLRSVLPLDLVTGNTKIPAGSYVVRLTFLREARFRIGDWELHKNTTIPGTVNSSTDNYYQSQLSEYDFDLDINRDGDKNDIWMLYLSDPDEDFVFDTVAIHGGNGEMITLLQEGDSIRLNGVPFMVYRVRERYVVFRYAQIRMEVR